MVGYSLVLTQEGNERSLSERREDLPDYCYNNNNSKAHGK